MHFIHTQRCQLASSFTSLPQHKDPPIHPSPSPAPPPPPHTHRTILPTVLDPHILSHHHENRPITLLANSISPSTASITTTPNSPIYPPTQVSLYSLHPPPPPPPPILPRPIPPHPQSLNFPGKKIETKVNNSPHPSPPPTPSLSLSIQPLVSLSLLNPAKQAAFLLAPIALSCSYGSGVRA